MSNSLQILNPSLHLRAKIANKYLKLATKTDENLAFLLLKHGVRGQKTMKKSKNREEQHINPILDWGAESRGFGVIWGGEHRIIK